MTGEMLVFFRFHMKSDLKRAMSHIFEDFD
jgi:hypothetical protein